VKAGRIGSSGAMKELSNFAIENYGDQIGNNMIRRSQNNPAKLFFALNQYAKNDTAGDSAAYRLAVGKLHVIGLKYKMQPKIAFNRTEDALSTENDLDSLAEKTPDGAFRDALLRMRAMIGWKPIPKTGATNAV
jgi:hypothetical protein